MINNELRVNDEDLLKETGFNSLNERELNEIFGFEIEADWKYEKDQAEDSWLKE